MFISVDTSEIHQLSRDIKAHSNRVPGQAERIMAAGGHSVVAAAQVYVPVDTGALKSSIGVDVNGLAFEAGPTVEYGVYQELGTSEMPPQPFMGPAFDRVEPQIIDAIGDLGEQIL